MPFKIVFFEASKLVTTKTLLLKHYYRRQGFSPFSSKRPLFGRGQKHSFPKARLSYDPDNLALGL